MVARRFFSKGIFQRFCGIASLCAIIPYHKPAATPEDLIIKTDKKWTRDQIWKQVLSTPSLGNLDENQPIVIEGQKYFDTIKQGKEYITMSCLRPATIAYNYAENYLEVFKKEGFTKTRRVLDLGCGQGANSFLYLGIGCHVVAIDKFMPCLESFKEEYQQRQEGTLDLLRADITGYDFQLRFDKFDLVLAVDVLPYIHPSQLEMVLQKIHQSLLPEGILIGSMFFCEPESPDKFTIMMNILGGHFLPSKELIPAILESVGFEVIECSVRIDDTSGTFRPHAAEFIVKKKPELK